MNEIGYKEFNQLARCYEDLSSQILHLLEKKPMKTIEIAKELGCSPRKVRYHLNKVQDKVERRRRKNEVFWGLKSKVKK